MMKKKLLLLLLIIVNSIYAQVGIGTTTPNSKSALDIVSNTRGVLMPRLTTAERDAINPEASTNASGVDGLLIYNTTTNCFNFWNRNTVSWETLCQNGPDQGSSCNPSVFADFKISCDQFPLADTNTYVEGQSVFGNTITVSVDVTKIGPYSITITSDNGVSYQKSGTFTALGLQNVVIEMASGSPSSSTLNFIVRGNGVTLCTYSKNATNTFAYTYNCSNAVVTPTMIQGVNQSGTVSVGINVTGTGDIPSFNTVVNGVTYSFAGITGATVGTTSIDITYSGTPTTASTILPLTHSNGSTCNVNISHPSGAAIFSCSSVSVTGNFIVGQTLTSQSITLIVDVSTVGSYPAMTYSANGMTFSAPSGNWTTTGNKTITFTGAGTPTTEGTNVLTPSNSSQCPVSVNVVLPFSYTYNCSGITPNPIPDFIVGVAKTGFFQIPVTVTGTGTIPSIDQTINGIRFTSNGTVSGGLMQINYTGTPTAPGTNNIVFNGSSASTNCTVPFNAVYGNATFSSCSIVSEGTYTVATTLTPTERLRVTLNVTIPGKINLVSEDKNGIKFSSGEVILAQGSQTVYMNSVSASEPFPMTAEEVSLGGNGANNQISTYNVYNTLVSTTTPISCSATLDVKPKVWSLMYTGRANALTNGADNGMLRLEMQDNDDFQSGISGYYKVWARNISEQDATTAINVRSGDDRVDPGKSWSGAFASNEALGSLDTYLQGNSNKPITTGEVGAHASPFVLLPEVSETGMLMTMPATTGARWFDGFLGAKQYKYRIIFNSRDYASTGTNTHIVLYGIYNSGATNYVTVLPSQTVGGEGGNPITQYWP